MHPLADQRAAAPAMGHPEMAEGGSEALGNDARIGQTLPEFDGLPEIMGQLAVHVLLDHGDVPGGQRLAFGPMHVDHRLGQAQAFLVDGIAGDGVQELAGRGIVLPRPGVAAETGKGGSFGQLPAVVQKNALVALLAGEIRTDLTKEIVDAQ